MALCAEGLQSAASSLGMASHIGVHGQIYQPLLVPRTHLCWFYWSASPMRASSSSRRSGTLEVGIRWLHNLVTELDLSTSPTPVFLCQLP
jgi:hypothetical protein